MFKCAVPRCADGMAPLIRWNPNGCRGCLECVPSEISKTQVQKEEKDDDLKGEPTPGYLMGEVEAPGGIKDMGSWEARVYTREQRDRLHIDEFGEALNETAAPTQPAVHKQSHSTAQAASIGAASKGSVSGLEDKPAQRGAEHNTKKDGLDVMLHKHPTEIKLAGFGLSVCLGCLLWSVCNRDGKRRSKVDDTYRTLISPEATQHL